MLAPSIFVAQDRVLITDGPFHGFAGTVVDTPSPGKLTLVIDGFHERSRFVVSDESVEPCKASEQLPASTEHL